MPRGDGTGPMGLGPMSGRAAGFCAGYGVPGYMNPIPGRGFARGFGPGLGFGRGRGWRNWYYATGLPGWARAGWLPAWGVPPYVPYGVPFAPEMTREQELEALKTQAQYFEEALEEIKKRIEELQTAAKQE